MALNDAATIEPGAVGRSGPGWLRWSIATIALAGAAISAVLAAMHFKPELASSLCASGAHVNCSEVLESRWAQLFSLPTAIWGLGYFITLTAWYVGVGLPNRAGRRWQLVPIMLTLIGIGVSIRLIYAMAAELSVWCPWCVVAHSLNVLLLAGGLLAWRQVGRAAEEDAERPYPRLSHAVIVLFFSSTALAGLAALYFSRAYATTRGELERVVNDESYIAWQHSLQDTSLIPIRPDDPCYGSSIAPHTAVIFSDFECPKCKELDALIPILLDRYPGVLRIVFKHHPLCYECNRAMQESYGCHHKHACEAARAAEAVRRVAGPAVAVQYHSLLFENSHRLAQKPYAELALKVGVSADNFQRAFDDPACRQRVIEDTLVAKAAGVQGSADVYLDGRRLPNWRMMDRNDRRKMHIEATMRMWGRLLGVLPPAPASRPT